MKHNQQISSLHFRKDWQRRVDTHFRQPAVKARRRSNRLSKAAAVAPRPTDKLRPVVRCPTVKYNRRARAGRGFTLVELKEAGIPRKLAASIGITVDPRRQTTNTETLALNVERLKSYKARLILFPRKSGQHKKLDSSADDIKAYEKEESKRVKSLHLSHPIVPGTGVAFGFKEIKKSDMPEGEKAAYRKLRDARSEARLAGAREKREKAKADAEDAKKK